MNNRFKLLSLIMSGTLVVACGNQAGSSSSQVSPGPVVNDVKPQIALDQISVLPVATGGNLSYRMRVNNFTNEIYSLTSVKITDMNGKKDKSDILKVTAPVGANIAANTSMTLNLEPRSNKSADLLLTVQVKKMDGGTETLRQIIRMSDSIKSSSGIASYNDLGTIITADNNYGLAIPFTLSKDFTNVKSINGEVSCQGQQFTKGNSCTLLVKGKLLAGSRYIKTDIVGYSGSKEVTRSNGGSLVRFGQEGNLLISHGSKIERADGASSVELVLFNNGTAAANLSSIAPILTDSNLIVNNNGCVRQDIPISGQCIITVAAQSEVSRFEGIQASYTTNTTVNKAVSTTVLYNGYSLGGDVYSLTYGIQGSLLRTLENETSSVEITLKNEGKANIDKLDIRLPQSQTNGSIFKVFDNSCSNNTPLASGRECSFKVEYSPTQVTPQNILNLNIVSSSANKPDTLLHIPVEYSAIAATNALAMVIADGSGDDFKILANTAGAERTNSFIIKNQSQRLSATLSELTSWNFSTGLTQNTLSNISINPGNCLTTNAATALAASSECQFDITYGSATGIAEHAGERGNLTVPFNIGANNSGTVDSPELYFEAIDGPLVDIVDPTTDIRVFSSNGINTMVLPANSPFTLNNLANGALNNPYRFIVPNINAYFAITYKFTNTSSENAVNFNVANLPYLGEIITTDLPIENSTDVVPATTCPTGATPSDLPANDECTLSLRLPLTDISQGNITANTIGEFLAADIDVVPELSYSNGNDVRIHRSPRFNRYFNYTRSWVNTNVSANPSTEVASYDQANRLWKITYTITPTSFPHVAFVNNATVTLKTVSGSQIEVTDILPNGANATCHSLAANSPCQFSLELSPDKFSIGGAVPVIFEITPPAGIAATPIEIKRSFGLANWTPTNP